MARRRVLPTREGVAWGLITASVIAVGLIGGNNLVVLVGAALAALGLAEALLGAWNLRGLEVARLLPEELFAAREGRGAFRVRNRRRWMPTLSLEIEDEGVEETSVLLGRIEPGRVTEVSAGWRFERRGTAVLRAVRIASTFPFGFARRERRIDIPAEILVYPTPLPWLAEFDPGVEGPERSSDQGTGISGDYAGLREYRPADRPTSIHWPTSARARDLFVVRRTGLAGERWVVRVPESRGREWEVALRRACGEVLGGFERGCEVGLELPDRVLEARSGSTWRRRLLDELASAPAREDG